MSTLVRSKFASIEMTVCSLGVCRTLYLPRFSVHHECPLQYKAQRIPYCLATGGLLSVILQDRTSLTLIRLHSTYYKSLLTGAPIKPMAVSQSAKAPAPESRLGRSAFSKISASQWLSRSCMRLIIWASTTYAWSAVKSPSLSIMSYARVRQIRGTRAPHEV